MLVLKLTVLLLVHGVLGRNTQRGNARHRLGDQEYTSSVNHPPEPEIYQGIPVSVVYEDESVRADKSIKSDNLTSNNFKEVNKEHIKIETSISKELVDRNTSNTEHTNVSSTEVVSGILDLDDQNPNKSKSSSTASTNTITDQDRQIPVAVVYELESSYYTRPNNNRISTKRRKVHQPSVDEKKVAVKDAPDASVTEKRYPHETATSLQEQTSSDLENTQQTSFRKHGPSVQEKQVVVEGTLKNNVTESQDKPQVPAIDKQQQFFSRSKSTQRHNSADPSAKETLVTVKETSESGNNKHQTFPKRDNSTREREFIPIIQSENLVFSHSGDFQYSYEGGDGTKAFEMGQLKTYEDDNTGEAVSGGFSYTDKDGHEYSLSYTADENGYRPVGAHLPTPPPIPPAIARALAYLATKTTPEPVTESGAESDY